MKVFDQKCSKCEKAIAGGFKNRAEFEAFLVEQGWVKKGYGWICPDHGTEKVVATAWWDSMWKDKK